MLTASFGSGILCGFLDVHERAGPEHHPAGGGEPPPPHRGHLQAGQQNTEHYFKPVLWIRIGFNADPDPVFLSLSGSGSREPNQKGSLSDFKVTQKVEYFG